MQLFTAFDDLLKADEERAPRVSKMMEERRNAFIASMIAAKGAMTTSSAEFVNFPPTVLNALASVSKMIKDFEKMHEDLHTVIQ